MTSSIKPWLSDPISLLKKDMRKNISLRLSKLTDAEISHQSDTVMEKPKSFMFLFHLLNAPWFRESQRISVYMNTKGEIETERIIEACLQQGKQLFIPQFTRGNPRMRLLRLPPNQFSSLQPTLWGIRQPALDSCWEDYEDSGPLDLVILPGVAFTLEGHRLGHGMGYYDRMLTNHKKQFCKMPRRYGLALREQIVEEVPLSETDVNLDGVIHS